MTYSPDEPRDEKGQWVSDGGAVQWRPVAASAYPAGSIKGTLDHACNAKGEPLCNKVKASSILNDSSAPLSGHKCPDCQRALAKQQPAAPKIVAPRAITKNSPTVFVPDEHGGVSHGHYKGGEEFQGKRGGFTRRLSITRRGDVYTVDHNGSRFVVEQRQGPAFNRVWVVTRKYKP